VRLSTQTSAAAIAIGLFSVAPAAAQTSPALEQTDGGLGEIVVTARRRAESLQDTPVAVTAVSAADLNARSAADISSVGDFTPNVTFDATAPISGSSNAVSVFIRGVGQTDFLITTDPGVGIYVDGVYIARSTGGLLGLMDLEQIEILRGPQGTLFGKNTIGGAVSVTTKRPSDELEAQAEVTVGRFDRFDLRGMVNLPINDQVAFRASIARNKRDGYGLGLLTGQEFGGLDNWTSRAAIRLQPNDAIDINLSADYTHGDEQSPVTSIVAGSGGIGNPGTLFAGLLYNNLITNAQTGLAPCQTPNFPIPFCGVPGLIQLPTLPADTLPYDERWLTNNLFTTNATGLNGSQYEIYGFSGTIDWNLGAVDLKSITAYRNSDSAFARDPDGSPIQLVETSNRVKQNQFSQELQFNGKLFDEKLDFILGAFYMREAATDNTTVPFGQATFDIVNDLGLGCILLPGLTGAPGPIAVPICPNIFRVDNLGDGTRIRNTTVALFGEASYKLTDALSLTAGLRWNRDNKKIDLSNVLTGGVPFSTANPRADRSFTELTPRFIANYEFSRDLMAYVSWSVGFKAGGFNGRYGAPIAAGPTSFEPERVKSWEAGLKTTFWDNRARLNLAGFYADYDDIQVVVFDNGIPRTINAAKGRIKGIEIEGSLAPVDPLLLQLSYGFIDASYTQLDASVTGSFGLPIVNPIGLDNQFVNTPRHTVSLSAQYTAPLSDWGSLVLRGDLNHRSETANDAINTIQLIQPAVTLLNARATLSPKGERWSLSLFGTNLTNRKYITSGVADEAGFGLVEVNAARPREWGITLGYDY
jgi:iron complex outermembrane receptor protein